MLGKHFDPAAAEAAIYQAWEDSGAFVGQQTGVPYTIVVPPPNVTGELHVGHALNFSLQDILVRWRRMQGFSVLWQPGTDHAGIATQMVVERDLAAQGLTRQALGREAFLAQIWDWKAQSGGAISRQLRRLGASVDWSRERFTMDEGLSAAVRRCFVDLHRRGLIYRDRRLVNWDPKFATAISDLEVESREVRGSLWHLRYPIEGRPGEYIVVATTRPETMLGDTAVAVHPADPRYQHLVGATVILPLTGRRIPVIADEHSDPEKGTGAVKITPAHDFNDFEVGRRHNLPMPSILDREAKITLHEIAADLASMPGSADPEFVRGLDGASAKDARGRMIEELGRLDLIETIEPHTHHVPHGDRSGLPVEPRLTTQWFVDAKILAAPAVEAVEDGRTKFVPKQWENTFFAWMRDIQPWCISRQLWWGHRIPAWYGPAGEIYVAETEAEAHALAGDLPIIQDEDVLDTWFSSALWPFSTLGWPDSTAELAARYPTSVLVTGFDIIFFWVARMVMLGLDQAGDVPFHTVYINALVRDERGQKMSKSKGNVVDPIALAGAYGTDALRYTLCALAGPGRDVRLGPTLVEANRSFVTKLWNAARFGENYDVTPSDFDPATAALSVSRWILHEASEAVAQATLALKMFRFDEYASACYRFSWNVYCDWFLELAKPAFMNDAPEAPELRRVAAHVFGIILRLLHPVMPFVTEALWNELGYGEPASLIRTAWPASFMVPDAAAAVAELSWVTRLIAEIRTVRAEMNVPPSVRTKILLKDASPATMARAKSWSSEICRLARGLSLDAFDGGVPQGAVQTLLDEATLILPLADVIDFAAERARLAREQSRAADDARKIAQKLANPDFVARAPEDVVQENRNRLTRAEAELARLRAAIARVG